MQCIAPPIPQPSPVDRPSASWCGNLNLEFSNSDGRTRLSHCFVNAPLKVQRPFYPEGDRVCHVVTLHTAGGVVGGDRLQQSLLLHPHTHALITSAAAGKIYRSNGHEAQQTTALTVRAGSCLEYFPQETIVFDGARYRQRLRVDLEDDALWMGWEITRLGRTARGERFTHGEWRSQTEVWQNGRLVWIDPQGISGGSAVLNSPHGLAGCPVSGSFVVVGRSLSSDWLEKIRLAGEGAVELERRSAQHSTAAIAGTQVGVTRLTNGLLCRYRGHSTLTVRRWFTSTWRILRPELVERSVCLPRVW